MDNMIKSVVREHHWSPEIIGDLFIDGGFDSLEYWYEDLKDQIKETKQNK